jgi:cold shock protein
MATEFGTVRNWNPERGFGFIAGDSGGKDVFVHVSSLVDKSLECLNPGWRVSFELDLDHQGRQRAKRVVVSEGADRCEP